MANFIAGAIDALNSQLFQGQANPENVSYRIKSADFVEMNLLDVNAVNRSLSLTKTTENFFRTLLGSCGCIAVADQRQDVFKAAVMMWRWRCVRLTGVIVVMVVMVMIVVVCMVMSVMVPVPVIVDVVVCMVMVMSMMVLMVVVMIVIVFMVILCGVGVDHIKVSADDSVFAAASGELQAYGCQSCLVECFFNGFRVSAEVTEGRQDHITGGACQGFKRDDSGAC